MPISGDTSALEDTQEGPVVELHWMKESDLAMSTGNGLTAPALCGAWVAPDPALMRRVEQGAPVRYASCTQCDLLADLSTEAMAV